MSIYIAIDREASEQDKYLANEIIKLMLENNYTRSLADLRKDINCLKFSNTSTDASPTDYGLEF